MNVQDCITKLSQLQPQCRWAAKQWVNDCFHQNIFFHVTEVYRTQAREEELYKQGRTTPGKIVTWTTHSLHTQRLAADIVMENGSYSQAEGVAHIYGIYRPADLVKLGDYGHFQFDKAIPQPVPPIIAPLARLQGLIRRQQTTIIPGLKQLLAGVIKRLAARLGVDSNHPND